MNQLTQKHLDTVKLIKQSEFEKPYLEDDYVPMEYAFYPPNYPPYAPQNPGGTVIPDCQVGVEASGSLDSWRECAEEDDCSAWIFTCAHKLISITCGYCTITKITPLEGDRLEVIICSKEDKLDVKYQTTENPSKPPEWKAFEEVRICCLKETISIGYTSQQMACNGTQVLTVIPGGGANDCYSWAITSGGGSLDVNTGNAVTYTAPSSNAGCANNPTITLTAKKPDGSTQTATLQIAVNCYAPIENAGIEVILEMCATPCCGKIKARYFRCSGAVLGYLDCCGCDCNNATCDCSLGVPPPDYCTEENIPVRCASSCGTGGPGQPCNSLGGSCVPRMVDIRTEAQKAGACCPQQLL